MVFWLFEQFLLELALSFLGEPRVLVGVVEGFEGIAVVGDLAEVVLVEGDVFGLGFLFGFLLFEVAGEVLEGAFEDHLVVFFETLALDDAFLDDAFESDVLEDVEAEFALDEAVEDDLFFLLDGVPLFLRNRLFF